MISLYFNIQHQKTKSSSGLSRSAELGGDAYGRQQQQQHVGLVNGTTGVKTGTSPAGAVVEMISKGRGSKRGSRGSSRRKRGSSSTAGGGYARVNGDADWDDDGAGRGGGRGIMMDSDEEEEVDLGLVRVVYCTLPQEACFSFCDWRTFCARALSCRPLSTRGVYIYR